MIVYMFQCHSPKSSHPLPLPHSPKVRSTHLCLFCCLAYRVIITIFLNSIYMCQEPITQSEVSQKEKHQYSILLSLFLISIARSFPGNSGDFPVGPVVKDLPAVQETRVQTLGQEGPLEEEWQPTPVFLPGVSHGQRSLAGYSP